MKNVSNEKSGNYLVVENPDTGELWPEKVSVPVEKVPVGFFVHNFFGTLREAINFIEKIQRKRRKVA